MEVERIGNHLFVCHGDDVALATSLGFIAGLGAWGIYLLALWLIKHYGRRL